MKRQKYRKEIIIKKYFALVVFESYQQFDLQISKLILEQKEEVHTVKKKKTNLNVSKYVFEEHLDKWSEKLNVKQCVLLLWMIQRTSKFLLK